MVGWSKLACGLGTARVKAVRVGADGVARCFVNVVQACSECFWCVVQVSLSVSVSVFMSLSAAFIYMRPTCAEQRQTLRE